MNMLESVQNMVCFLNNFENLSSIDLLSLNDPKYSGSKFFANKLKLNLQELMKRPEPKDTSADKIKLKILILQREVDMVTPAILDLHYEPLLSDVLKIDLKQTIHDSGQKIKFDDSCELYGKYRYKFFKDILEQFSGELRKFKEKYSMIINGNDDLNGNKIGEAIRNVAEHNREKTEIVYFSKQNKKLDNWITEDILNYSESMMRIATGISDNGGNLQSSDRLKDIASILSSTNDQDLKLRILMIGTNTITKDMDKLSMCIGIT